MIARSYAVRNDSRESFAAYMPPGEWLGSGAEEGRAKLRYYLGEAQGA